jgi:tRNA nucleotidyltransferase (CCA-adding enzyme)
MMDTKNTIRLGRSLHPWEKVISNEGDLYLVGGIVRDLMLGGSSDSPDTDYVVCGIEYERLVSLLETFGRTHLVGKSFGVIKFEAPDGEIVDISLPRTEVSTGEGHRDFDVRYDPKLSIENDLERRDYTINSMALAVRDQHIVDPLGGRKDLGERILRVNRESSFVEDPLRMLRGVQFMARFDLSVEAETRLLMEKHADLLGTVSAERVRVELNKLMLSPRPSEGFVFMHETDLLRRILPELDDAWGVEQNEFHPDDVFIHSVKSCDAAPPELIVRWAALLHDIDKPKMKQVVEERTVFYRHEEEGAETARRILDRLRFPVEFTNKVSALVARHMFNITDEWSDGALRRFVAKVGRENLEDLYALRIADARSRGDEKVEVDVEWIRGEIDRVLEQDATLKRTDLAISGRDVMELLGIEEGTRIGEVLEALLERVMDDPALNERDRLIELVREMRDNK